MATKKTKAVEKTSVITANKIAELRAVGAVLPCANAAMVVAEYATAFGEQDTVALTHQLRAKFSQVNDGNLQLCEEMLVGQAHALQSIFVNLARRASVQQQQPQFESFMRLALKAQNQSRATLETLAAIKNPPVIFARQANINQGNGNQQVNNGATPTTSHAGKTVNQQNELLEVQHGGEALDRRTTCKAGGDNQAVAALETVNRSKNAGG
jgi:hypothetical protein